MYDLLSDTEPICKDPPPTVPHADWTMSCDNMTTYYECEKGFASDGDTLVLVSCLSADPVNGTYQWESVNLTCTPGKQSSVAAF